MEEQDNEESNPIISKIKKLLALATSPNENEAKAAARKAQELLVAHNLDMQAVERHESDYDEKTAAESGGTPSEWKFCTIIIRDYFFCRVIWDKVSPKHRILLLGQKTNLQIAQYTFDFLVVKFRQCWKEYKDTHSAEARSRQSFYTGFFQGICDQLQEGRQSVETSRGLVLVRDKQLDKFVTNKYPFLGTKRHGMGNVNDAHAVAAGREQGKALKFARGLGGPAKKTGLLIK